MARATPSRNLFGFGKRKPARKRKASSKPKRRMLGWLTDKKETYRRSAKDERAELIRKAKAARGDQARQKREDAAAAKAKLRDLLEEAKDDGYLAGQTDKRSGKRPIPYRISLIVSPRYEEAFGKRRAHSIVHSAYMQGYRQNPERCARTMKSNVSDRAQRYRANQPGCRPSGLKKCKLCGSRSDVMVDHVDGNESNGRKSNLRWLCRSCNNTLGAEMAKTGQGRRTVQYNPAHKGAQTLGEYMQAVLQHTRGAHDAAGKIIHDTPKSRRREFASEIWARREAHGTVRPGSSRASGQEPDWVTNPRRNTESTTEYRLGYNLGQSDRQTAQLRKTPGELHATFVANFGAVPSADWLAFDQAYQAGFGVQMGAVPNPSWSVPSDAPYGTVGIRALESFERPRIGTILGASRVYEKHRATGRKLKGVSAFDARRSVSEAFRNALDWKIGGSRVRRFAALAGEVISDEGGRTVEPGEIVIQNAEVLALYEFSGGRMRQIASNPRQHPNPEQDLEDDGSEQYQQAKRIAELFHGRPVKEHITVTESIHTPDWYAALGPLVELRIKGFKGAPFRRANFKFPVKEGKTIQFFASPDGKQFYLRGGDQEIDLDALGMGQDSEWYRDSMLIGEVTYFVYRDGKRFHKYTLTDYSHKVGSALDASGTRHIQKTNVKPVMVYDTLSKKISLAGGLGKIETETLVEGMSPGIVQ